VPYAPRIVSDLLRYGRFVLSRPATRFPKNHREIGWRSAEELAESVLDPEGEVPVVVVTPTDAEGNDLKEARKRAKTLQRHLKGLAPIIKS